MLILKNIFLIIYIKYTFDFGRQDMSCILCYSIFIFTFRKKKCTYLFYNSYLYNIPI